MIDGKLHTYWQASSTEKCEFHCIQIFLKDNIKLTNISLSSIGSRDDDFLKSVVIEVRAGGGNRSDSVIAKCDYLLTISNEYAICKMYTDARVQKIYGGTNEIMKELIARSL